MVVKIDLEKAYDQIDWSFLEKILVFTGFKTFIRDLIMSIITSSLLHVCWNGEVLEDF